MTRTIAILSVFLAACDVGSVPTNHGVVDSGNSQTDGNGSGSSKMDGSAGVACVNNVGTALTPAAHIHQGSGNSNAGKNCMASGCHGVPTGQNASPFTYAGTAYTTTAGTTGMAGATIRVKYGASTDTQVTDTDGNFHSGTAVTFPLNVDATSCPALNTMTAALVTGQGGCNGCHAIGGTTTPIAIH